MELETCNKLFLELSQFTTATTRRESELLDANKQLFDKIEQLKKETELPCIWSVCKRDAELMDTACEELHLINVSNDRDFKFCPYCGKRRVLAESV